jgi:hypothetical protein
MFSSIFVEDLDKIRFQNGRGGALLALLIFMTNAADPVIIQHNMGRALR